MDRWQNKIAVVTGASSGIGAQIVKDLLAAGLVVVGLARRQQRVEQIRSQLPEAQQKRLHAIKCDVSKLESVSEAFDWIETQLGGVDILVNNAGISTPGHLSTMDVQVVQQQVQTNIMGVVYCTQRAFKSMKQRNFAGHVLLLNSIQGHSVLNGVSLNHLILITAMNEIYRTEFSGLDTQIKITSISPGLVDTEIVPKKVVTKMSNGRILQAKDISQCVLFAISTPPDVQIHELIVKPLNYYSKM